MNDSIYNVWSRELLPGETLLWTGKPNSSVLFSKFDILFIPFSAISFLFAIFWVVRVAGSGGGVGGFAVFGIPFVLASLYFLAGRFFYKKHKKMRTAYAITDRRVMSVVFNAKGQQTKLICSDVKQVNNSSISLRQDGVGTILFGADPHNRSIYLNTGMDYLAFDINDVVAFVDVDDASKVYELYKALRSR